MKMCKPWLHTYRPSSAQKTGIFTQRNGEIYNETFGGVKVTTHPLGQLVYLPETQRHQARLPQLDTNLACQLSEVPHGSSALPGKFISQRRLCHRVWYSRR